METLDPSAMTMLQRLRKNAEQIARGVGGDDWRTEIANEMGCDMSDVGVGPVGRTRDSEPLEESNFRVVLRDLGSVDARVSTVRFGHWGYGWVEEIAVPLDNERVVERVEGWVEQLTAYPAADDMDLAELEAEYTTSVDEVSAEVSPEQQRLSELQRRLDSLGSNDQPDLAH